MSYIERPVPLHEGPPLLACPFCGGAPTYRTWSCYSVTWQVVCLWLGCPVNPRTNTNFDTAEEVAAAWNTRTQPWHVLPALEDSETVRSEALADRR